MRRGELWWARFPKPVGTRPVVLLSRDEAYRVRASVTVAPVTTRIRGLPVEVPLGSKEGLPRPCVVNLDSIGTIEKALLTSRIGALSPEQVEQVNCAIKFALDLP
ncbi:MAG: type II toxin-antitoxin system PemK/MazF family toxin [Candidatus Omnitrophica bacterium]|nr:type II toxin-antitoxin system PemK/MazF family toxin [Candidatus Omnitrophota bacterium]